MNGVQQKLLAARSVFASEAHRLATKRQLPHKRKKGPHDAALSQKLNVPLDNQLADHVVQALQRPNTHLLGGRFGFLRNHFTSEWISHHFPALYGRLVDQRHLRKTDQVERLGLFQRLGHQLVERIKDGHDLCSAEISIFGDRLVDFVLRGRLGRGGFFFRHLRDALLGSNS